MTSFVFFGRRPGAFSLVEVVLALGVVSFAIVAILGVFPLGLRTGRSAQDETRAAQIAQAVFSTFANQPFDNVVIPLYDDTGMVNGAVPALNLSNENGSGPAWNANAKGEVFVSGNPVKFLNPPSLPVDTTAAYSVTLLFSKSPVGFDPPSGGKGFGNQITVAISWPAIASVANRTTRNFVQTISRY